VVVYSACGNHGACWVAWGVLAGFAGGSARQAVAVAATVWGTLAVNFAIKSAVRRDRPDGDGVPAPLIRAPRSHSFPSSHAAMSTAAVFVLPPLAIPAAAVMVASRVYLAVHYPSDVAAGVVVGLGCGALAVMLGA
jgi:undecaprenyl-diphosphatase